jgi:hypothetical protein
MTRTHPDLPWCRYADDGLVETRGRAHHRRPAAGHCLWLIGHWFARVLVFLMLAVVGFVAGANVTPHNPAGSIICGLIGTALMARARSVR